MTQFLSRVMTFIAMVLAHIAAPSVNVEPTTNSGQPAALDGASYFSMAVLGLAHFSVSTLALLSGGWSLVCRLTRCAFTPILGGRNPDAYAVWRPGLVAVMVGRVDSVLFPDASQPQEFHYA